MSYSTCMTCNRRVRDFDEQMDGNPTRLPDHGCADPHGSWPWNDGRHTWSEALGDWVPIDGDRV